MDGGSNPTEMPMLRETADARVLEFNHRVLNSLTMISSMIGIESRALEDEAGRAALERVRSRLVAVSNLYRILSGSESDSQIDAGFYLSSVADAVAGSVGSDDRVAVDVQADSCRLSTKQAAIVGLITNEAMTNAYKHAFSGRSRGRITVSLRNGPGALTLTIADDGRGMEDTTRDGLGTTLIESLVIDLGGDLSLRSDGSGTAVRVSFPG